MDEATRKNMLKLTETKVSSTLAPLRGVGDLVAATTKALGIKPCAPCQKRQEQLNKMLPFRRRQP